MPRLELLRLAQRVRIHQRLEVRREIRVQRVLLREAQQPVIGLSIDPVRPLLQPAPRIFQRLPGRHIARSPADRVRPFRPEHLAQRHPCRLVLRGDVALLQALGKLLHRLAGPNRPFPELHAPFLSRQPEGLRNRVLHRFHVAGLAALREDLRLAFKGVLFALADALPPRLFPRRLDRIIRHELIALEMPGLRAIEAPIPRLVVQFRHPAPFFGAFRVLRLPLRQLPFIVLARLPFPGRGLVHQLRRLLPLRPGLRLVQRRPRLRCAPLPEVPIQRRVQFRVPLRPALLPSRLAPRLRARQIPHRRAPPRRIHRPPPRSPLKVPRQLQQRIIRRPAGRI